MTNLVITLIDHHGGHDDGHDGYDEHNDENDGHDGHDDPHDSRDDEIDGHGGHDGHEDPHDVQNNGYGGHGDSYDRYEDDNNTGSSPLYSILCTCIFYNLSYACIFHFHLYRGKKMPLGLP